MAVLSNPVVYFDPVTKKTYSPFTITLRSISDAVRRRVLTRILAWDNNNLILEEFVGYRAIPDDFHREIQETYTALGPDAPERLYEIFESYPTLIKNMIPLESIDWSPISKDMYHTKDTYIKPSERRHLLAEAKKAFLASHKQSKRLLETPVPPVIWLYYKKKLKHGKRSKDIWKRRVTYKKLTTSHVREAIADVLDGVQDTIDYFYVVAERKSAFRDGMEYRTIVKSSTLT